jgi:inhibitor of KinA
MRLEPLGDQAVMAYGPEEAAAGRFALQVRQAAFPWVVDVVQAYTSVAVYYDLTRIDFPRAQALLAQLGDRQRDNLAARFFTIPCCYELGLDWQRLEEQLRLAAEQIIAFHLQTVYTVYAIGFCPGFPYLGYLPQPISGVPRLPSPRVKLMAGSVGITGNQTGIYTEERPGGWNIVGRTPCCLVDVADGYFPLRAGDTVEFTRIEGAEFQRRLGERLV